jgi:hypothetical protein
MKKSKIEENRKSKIGRQTNINTTSTHDENMKTAKSTKQQNDENSKMTKTAKSTK